MLADVDNVASASGLPVTREEHRDSFLQRSRFNETLALAKCVPAKLSIRMALQ